MNLSKKILATILGTQLIILGVAFWGFSRSIERSHLEREASVFHVTTNLEYSELLQNPKTTAAESMVQTARYISRLPGMVGVSLFNDRQEIVLNVPDDLPSAGSDSLDSAPNAFLVRQFKLPSMDPSLAADSTGKVLQIDIPLLGSQAQPVAYLRFYRRAEAFVSEVAEQKKNLLFLGLLAVSLAVGITTTVFLSYDRILKRKEKILRAKNSELLNAQRHLLLSSQMNAVGSMTAHLIHDLKSYSSKITMALMGLSKHHGATVPELKSTCEMAAEMDKHIREFLSFLRSNGSEFQSTYTVDEILTILHKKLTPVADKGDLNLNFENNAASFDIDFKKGNFLILILQNLLHNAIESTPREGTVRLGVAVESGIAEFTVNDEGKGIPAEDQRIIFMPKNSFKQGGTGLGLAICAQMAYHIRAGISLESSGPDGTTFKVTLPLKDGKKQLVEKFCMTNND